MYQSDCLSIREACRKDDNAIIGAGLLVLLSIRQPFYSVPEAMRDVQNVGQGSRFLWGSKRDGYKALVRNVSVIRQYVLDYDQSGDFETLVIRLMQVPNMSFAKASFFAQMLTGEGACLDSHNLARLGLGDGNRGAIKKTLTEETMRRHYRLYDATWRAHGDSAYWWDTWCEYVADSYPDQYENAADVSSVHLIAIHFQPNPSDLMELAA